MKIKVQVPVRNQGGFAGGFEEVVTDWPDGFPVPPNAEVVPDKTPVTQPAEAAPSIAAGV